MAQNQPPSGTEKQSLSEHVKRRAAFIRDKYELGSPAKIRKELLDVMLSDREVARFPTELFFTSQIEEGLFGICRKKSEDPRDGYQILLHSSLKDMGNKLAMFVFYLLVQVNYGDFASCQEAELFAASILDVQVDDYYRELCHLVDTVIQSDHLKHSSCTCKDGGA
ncbi:MAG: hypothetical protein CSA81_05140 [Acidobacteria bacterium]|nr:MAG: hypothetical protein CSA81_05140 [Acidobacteriota bacterium]PIE91026.1 MAG: hypothetical protein CR997_02595 [Acidobacteriota bacterium]